MHALATGPLPPPAQRGQTRRAGARVRRAPLCTAARVRTQGRQRLRPIFLPTAGRAAAARRRGRMRLSGALGAVLMTVLSNLEGTASFENVQCLGAGTNCTTGPAHICSTPPLGSWLAQDGVKGYVPTIMRVCRCPNITFSGPMCDKECPHGHSNPCNGHGECLFASSTCACDFGWQGERPNHPLACAPAVDDGGSSLAKGSLIAGASPAWIC